MSRLPHTISNQSLTFFVQGKPYSLTRGHEHFDAAKRLLQSPGSHPVQQLVDMVDARQALLRDSHGALQIIGADLVYRGQPLRGLWVDKIKAFRAAGEPFAPLFNALGSLVLNPTPEAVERLPVFLEKSNLGFLEDGRFIAYKAVREDYLDIHSGTFRNMVGDTPHMPRDQVNSDPNACCSTGLHVGTPDYVKDFGLSSRGRRVMLIAVWPHDVVSVPHSYGGTKMRICAYEVIDELDDVYAGTILGRPVLTPRSQLPTTVIVEGDSITLQSNDGHDLRGEAEAMFAHDVEPEDEDDEDDLYEGEDDGEDDDTFLPEEPDLGELVEVGDVVTLMAAPGIGPWDHSREAGDYSVRVVGDGDLLVEGHAGRAWVARSRVVAATRRGIDLTAAPAQHARVGDQVELVEGGWPPAGVYPVVKVEDGLEYRLTVQTEHDGEQGVLNKYVRRVIPA